MGNHFLGGVGFQVISPYYNTTFTPTYRYDVESELNEMEMKLKSVGGKAKFTELLKPRTRYPLIIALFMMVTQQVNIVLEASEPK